MPTQEFGATFVHVTDWPTFLATLQEAEDLYARKGDDIEALLSDSFFKQLKRGILAPKRSTAMREATAIVDKVTDAAAFKEALDAAYSTGKVSREKVKAWEKVSALA